MPVLYKVDFFDAISSFCNALVATNKKVPLFFDSAVCFFPVGSGTNLIGSGLIALGGEHPHGGLSDHYVHCLAKAFKDVFLDVWNPVLFADGLELGCTFLVLKHGQIRPHMVLDLVVEPAMREINGIGACGIVCASNNLTHVKATSVWLYSIIKGIQILSRCFNRKKDKIEKLE